MEEPVGARPSVVIVGAGFGGLRVARALRGAPVDVTVIDQHNYHTFVPLLYQVATAGLEPEENSATYPPYSPRRGEHQVSPLPSDEHRCRAAARHATARVTLRVFTNKR